MSQFDLSGKVAIITGSSRGIGKASAFELAEHGAKVVISSRKQEACDAVAAEINARYGEGRAIAVAANISDKAGLQHLVDATRAAFGQIDVLVCNAASLHADSRCCIGSLGSRGGQLVSILLWVGLPAADKRSAVLA